MTQEQATRYPIVLVPGLLGFVKLVVYPYWYGIVPALRRGGAEVIPVMVSAVNATEIRGEQLLARIEEILKETGAAKVNLIGHSQGALTIRYVAGVRPDLVASVTSVAGPNHGSELADYLEEHYPQSTLRGRLVNAAIRLTTLILALLDTGYRGTRLPTDVDAAHHSLTTRGVARFNTHSSLKGCPRPGAGRGLSWSTACAITPGPAPCNRGARTAARTCSIPRISPADYSLARSRKSEVNLMAWSGDSVRTWARSSVTTSRSTISTSSTSTSVWWARGPILWGCFSNTPRG